MFDGQDQVPVLPAKRDHEARESIAKDSSFSCARIVSQHRRCGDFVVNLFPDRPPWTEFLLPQFMASYLRDTGAWG